VLNAAEGADLLHVDAAFNTDFANDPMHYKVETNRDGGTVTTIVIPYTNPVLPLLMPMLEKGADPAKLAKLSATLKPIIDSAYKRNAAAEKTKWVDGVVNLPLPVAQPSVGGGESLRPLTQRTALVPTPVKQDEPTPPVDTVGEKYQLGDGVRDEIEHDKIKKDETEQDSTSRMSRTLKVLKTLRTARTSRRSAIRAEKTSDQDESTETHQAAPQHDSSPDGADAG
jgi:3'-(hydroxy)phthioceranyl-2'-palmitoyl(stearoyl)-2-O-sulfo-trehalose (hydroxy)phthioceranyltransferase